MYGDLQNSVDLGGNVPGVCSETHVTHSADGSEVCDIKVEEVSETQEEDPLAVALPAVKAEHEVGTRWLLVFCCLEIIAQGM